MTAPDLPASGSVAVKSKTRNEGEAMTKIRFLDVRDPRRDNLLRLSSENYLADLHAIGQRYGYADVCEQCEGTVLPEGANIDHIIHWRAGGCDHYHNKRVLCRTHNAERSNLLDSSMRFHCKQCRREAYRCWRLTVAEHGMTEQVAAWKRRNGFHNYVSCLWDTHDGQDSLL